MKKTCTIFIIFMFLLVLQISVSAQTKFDEYTNISTDEETARLDGFIIELSNKPKAKGYFVIYNGKNNTRIGNILPYLEGIKKHFFYRNFNTDRVSFIVVENREIFTREIWIINEGDEIREFNEIDNNFLNELKENYLYATQCVVCEPAEPHLATDIIDWDLLAQTLRKNSDYEVLLKIGKNSEHYDLDEEKMISAKSYAKKLRKRFSKKYKIDKSRIAYKVTKEGSLRIYIIPKKK